MSGGPARLHWWGWWPRMPASVLCPTCLAGLSSSGRAGVERAEGVEMKQKREAPEVFLC